VKLPRASTKWASRKPYGARSAEICRHRRHLARVALGFSPQIGDELEVPRALVVERHAQAPGPVAVAQCVRSEMAPAPGR
jgi:hypothetical protein